MFSKLAALLFVSASVLLLACSGNSNTSATATNTPISVGSPVTSPTTQPTVAATATTAPATATTAPSTATPVPSSPTPSTGTVPAAPTNLQITGALPDLHTPVPPGEGEQGRITVSWQDNSNNEDGFRILNDCNGTISTLAEVGANETSLGPLQSCRPGRVGVVAFNASGTSDPVWSPA